VADFERKMVEAYGVRREDVAGYSGMPNRSVRSQEEPFPDYEQVVAAATEVAGT
jgi:hypothetical protein